MYSPGISVVHFFCLTPSIFFRFEESASPLSRSFGTERGRGGGELPNSKQNHYKCVSLSATEDYQWQHKRCRVPASSAGQQARHDNVMLLSPRPDSPDSYRDRG